MSELTRERVEYMRGILRDTVKARRDLRVGDIDALCDMALAKLAAAPKQDVVAVPRDVFDRTLEYFEGREDASTDSGKWQGNEEMYLLQDLRAADKEGKP